SPLHASPAWYLGVCTFSNSATPNQCSGSVDSYRNGQTLTGPYKPPVPATSAGQLTLTFTANDTVTMTWAGPTVVLTRFRFGTGNNPTPGPGSTGWWWNANESGRG